MLKPTRKRRYDQSINVQFEIEAPKNKHRPVTGESLAEEEQLNKILFGGASSFLKSLEEASLEAGPSTVDSGVGEDDSEDSEPKERPPAWCDDDDDGIEVGQALSIQGRKLPEGGINDRRNKYQTLLKHKFQSLMGNPKWASLDERKERDSDSDDEILQSCGFLRKSQKIQLAANSLEFKKVRDVNFETYCEGAYINANEFHPTSSVCLVAGHNGIASLYAVDGKKNSKLHSVAFQHFPIFCAKFIKNGNEAILGSRHAHIFSYDLIAAKPTRIPLPHGITQAKNFIVSPNSNIIALGGKWGEVHILSASSKERIATIKQDSEVTALEFNPDGNLLFGHGDNGEVTVWDANMWRVKHKFIDEGCLNGTKLAISSSNQFLATGSGQGVVNLYDMDEVLKTKLPKPKKTTLNLTTSITDLKFNSTSEILALASAELQNSIKLLHVSSRTIFSNFPTFGTKLGNVNVVNFSPGSGYVALGNRKSTVALFRLKHYKNY